MACTRSAVGVAIPKLGTCIWAQHGVWDTENGAVVVPDYFRYLASGE